MRGKQEKAWREGNNQVKWMSTNKSDFNRWCDVKTHHTLDPILSVPAMLYLTLSKQKITLNGSTCPMYVINKIWSILSHFYPVTNITQIYVHFVWLNEI